MPQHTSPGAEPVLQEKRCVCNRLICVLNGDIIEIKCPKCKRLVKIHTRGIEEIRVADATKKTLG